jgi:transposase-like protein
MLVGCLVVSADENPFRYFKTSPDVIRLAVMMYVRFPLSLRQVEDLLRERSIDISYETVCAWWNGGSWRYKTRQPIELIGRIIFL